MTTRRGTIRFTLDLPRDLHKALRRYAVETDMHASEILRELLRDFLASKAAGDRAVEAALYRRGYDAGAAAERDRIAQAIQITRTNRPGLPTSPPASRQSTAQPPSEKSDRPAPGCE